MKYWKLRAMSSGHYSHGQTESGQLPETFIRQQCDMVPLTEKEILVELQKFGINSPSELNSYIQEYKTYCAFLNIHMHSPQEGRKEMESG